MTVPPRAHCVIRASAGSGKTFRLTNHFLGLLADGVPPAQLWAATFTRKAAGEILDRIVQRLAMAATSDAAARELAAHIERPALRRPDFTRLLRRLLADLHRLRIGTLDSLFLNLAGCFVLECGLPPGWSIADEADAQAAAEAALDAVLSADPAKLPWLAALLRGEARRGVRAELLDRAENWFAAFRAVPKDGWQCAPPSAPTEALADLLDEMRAVDLGKDKRMTAARDADCERARAERWDEFAGTGLAAKVVGRDPKYYGKPIPPELVGCYEGLLALAECAVRRELAAETAALWDFLAEFHRHREANLRSGGGLRFDDIAHALGAHLRPHADGFAFRIDGRLGHLLLDEFQDTSTSQWTVLRELARACLKSRGTVFAVGDVKQAIYGWRGGRAELLQRLPDEFDERLPTFEMDESRRSAPAVIDAVNAVFAQVAAVVKDGPWRDGERPWNGDFRPHTTARGDRAGFVCVETGPAEEVGEGVNGQRGRHYARVAERIAEIVLAHPAATVGVLCRSNDAVGRMLYELRERGVDASEEGGNAIDDSAAVEIVLSLLTFADHPGDEVAAFHLQHSPLRDELVRAGIDDRAAFAAQLRAALLTDGCAAVVERWSNLLAPLCPHADRLRLLQLVELADAYEARAALRPAAFVAWVRKQRVALPTANRVRVLTLHKAKGLEFDAVVLPQLDVKLLGKAGDFVVVAPDPTLLPDGFFARRVSKDRLPLVGEEAQRHIEAARRREYEESLSLLYVALTRPRQALYAFPPGPQQRGRTDCWDTVLLAALGCTGAVDVKSRPAESVVYKIGTPDWQLEPREPRAAAPPPAVKPIRLTRPAASARRVEWVAPSGLEAGCLVSAASLFEDSDSSGRDIGTLHHAWYEAVVWLDAGEPSDAELRDRAAAIPYVRDDIEVQIAHFRKALRRPEVRAALSKPTGAAPPIVEVERAFCVRDGGRIVNGRLDRLVWLTRPDGTLVAEVCDYKTDGVPPDGLAAKVEHYRPQMEAYIRAVASFGNLPVSCVSATLLFTNLGRAVRLTLADS